MRPLFYCDIAGKRYTVKKIELKLTCQFPNDADRTPLNIHLDENSKVIHLNVCPDLLQMFLHRDILMFQQIV